VQCVITCSHSYQGQTVSILVVQDQDCRVHMATLSIRNLWWHLWCTH